jgi:hypothetical protein
MMLPAAADRGIVVFRIWPSLGYSVRLAVAFGLVAAGLIWQAASLAIAPGVILIVAGNLLLLVRGYDNRVDFGRYRPDAQWERAGLEKLDELVALDRRIRRWDLDLLDATNPLGAILFALLAGLLGLAMVFTEGMPRLLAADAAVLLLPHWVTGIRRILRLPRLLVKVQTIRHVLDQNRDALATHRVDLMLLLEGTETRIPSDVKFKVSLEGHAPGFLGLYGQVVLNEVQGTSYPYFYVVLVAQGGFGLEPAYRRYLSPDGLASEFKLQGDVEVWVLRQFTTKRSGYHTKPAVAGWIFEEGLALAKQVAGGS